MPSAQISPQLIQLLMKKIAKIIKLPTVSSLTGKYVGLINKQKEKIEGLFDENSFMHSWQVRKYNNFLTA